MVYDLEARLLQQMLDLLRRELIALQRVVGSEI
jgi:hypothetical protein